MKVLISVVDDKGEVLFHHEADALVPTSKKLDPEKPIKYGDYQFFGCIYQPIVLLRSKAGGF
jgi:hypothetical protein